MNPATAGYLDRISYPDSEPPKPTVATLHALHAAHNRSIPFENLDPILGKPVADLGVETLTDKLVSRRRGGYCYEQNGLFGYVLEDLGYRVQRLAGRVLWMSGQDVLPAAWDVPVPALTHNVLAVTVPGEADRYLVDVGFGGQTLSSPILLRPGPVQRTRHEPYRLVAAGAGALRLEAEVRGAWQPLYVFGTEPQRRTDLEVGSWYVSTHPESIFVRGLSAALVTDDARWNLRGRDLAVHSGGGTERIRLATAADVLDQLTGRFGIDLTGLGDDEAAVDRVLTDD